MFLNPIPDPNTGLFNTSIFKSTHSLFIGNGEKLAVPYDQAIVYNHFFSLFDSTFTCLESGLYGLSFSAILECNGGPGNLKGSVQGYIKVMPYGTEYHGGFILFEDNNAGLNFDPYIMSYGVTIYLRKGWTFQIILEKVVNDTSVIITPISAHNIKTVLSIQRI